MFFVLSKTIGLLLNPLIWITAALVLAITWKKYRTLLLKVSLGLFIFFSSPITANLAMKWLEVPPQGIPQDQNVGIVLTGVVDAFVGTGDQVAFSEGAERLIETVALYHDGHIQKILIVGGSGLLLDQDFSEGQVLANFTNRLNVPTEDIWVEPNSRNTHENAVLAKEIYLANLKEYQPVLITSSFHMKRSAGCFKKEGLDVITFPVDFRASLRFYDYNFWFPASGAFIIWSVVIRELFGLTFYWVAGYI